MSSGENKLIRRRLAGAWLSSVISITLVLLLVGVASLLLVNAKSVSDYFKENVQVSVLMRPDVTEDEAMNYATTLDAMPFIKGTRFISKEEGTRDMTDMLGEDFLSVFESTVKNEFDASKIKGQTLSFDTAELVLFPMQSEENSHEYTLIPERKSSHPGAVIGNDSVGEHE